MKHVLHSAQSSCAPAERPPAARSPKEDAISRYHGRSQDSRLCGARGAVARVPSNHGTVRLALKLDLSEHNGVRRPRLLFSVELCRYGANVDFRHPAFLDIALSAYMNETVPCPEPNFGGPQGALYRSRNLKK